MLGVGPIDESARLCITTADCRTVDWQAIDLFEYPDPRKLQQAKGGRNKHGWNWMHQSQSACD
jgi:hypothetical protein